jgi:hypothetical protein
MPFPSLFFPAGINDCFLSAGLHFPGWFGTPWASPLPVIRQFYWQS